MPSDTPGRRPSTDQDQSAPLSLFLLVSFDQGLSALLYLVFSPPVTLPSHFSRVFAGGHFPALGYTGAIQVTTFVPAPMCVSSMPFIPLGPDPNHIPVVVTTSPEVNHSSRSPERACHEAITVYHIVHSSTVVALQYIMSEGLFLEVDLLITIYVKCKLSDSNFV